MFNFVFGTTLTPTLRKAIVCPDCWKAPEFVATELQGWLPRARVEIRSCGRSARMEFDPLLEDFRDVTDRLVRRWNDENMELVPIET